MATINKTTQQKSIEVFFASDKVQTFLEEHNVPPLILIQPGTFLMGATMFDSEMPSHLVTITKPFGIGKYQVTQEEFKAFMGTNPSQYQAINHPVEQVNWEEACLFCEKINEILSTLLPEHYHIALPSEAQWEYACRAGSTTEYSYGDNPSTEKMNYGGCKIKHPVRVGSYPPNPWGLYDMHGNVWEWCQDWYGPYSGCNEIDPTGPNAGPLRVVRGGSWFNIAEDCRSAHRHTWVGPRYRHSDYGFRIALVPM